MYRKILVPLDGSPSAENVLPYARALAKRLALAVDLLEVVDIAEMARSVPAAEGLFINQLADDEAGIEGVAASGLIDGIDSESSGAQGHVAAARERARAPHRNHDGAGRAHLGKYLRLLARVVAPGQYARFVIEKTRRLGSGLRAARRGRDWCRRG